MQKKNPLKNNHRMHPQRMVWRIFLRCVSAVWPNEMALSVYEWNDFSTPPKVTTRHQFFSVFFWGREFLFQIMMSLGSVAGSANFLGLCSKVFVDFCLENLGE